MSTWTPTKLPKGWTHESPTKAVYRVDEIDYVFTLEVTLCGDHIEVEIEEPNASSVPGGACLSGDIPLTVIRCLMEN